MRSIPTRIQLRSDSSVRWEEENPVLLDGELGYDITTNNIKFGDGVTPWLGLSYVSVNNKLKLDNGEGTNSLKQLGSSNQALADLSFATGEDNIVGETNPNGTLKGITSDGKFYPNGYAGFAEGGKNKVYGRHSHAEGYDNIASGHPSHVEGGHNIASGDVSHAEGQWTRASGVYSHTEGLSTKASGIASHAGGVCTNATVIGQTSLGMANEEDTNALFIVGNGDVAYNDSTANYDVVNRKTAFKVLKNGSVVQGVNNNATGAASYATGENNKATANWSYAGGANSTASANGSHAEGDWCYATTPWSTALGKATHATAEAQTVVGRFNTDNTEALFVVGNGLQEVQRSNALVVHSDGRATVGANPVDIMDIVNKSYLESKVNNDGHSHRLATRSLNGFMSSTDKKALDTIKELLEDESSDNKYEFIGRYWIGYTVQTQKPSDWETNYTNYYKDVSTDIKKPEYQALTELETWETGKYFNYKATGNLEFSISREYDGTNFFFRKVIGFVYKLDNTITSQSCNCLAYYGRKGYADSSGQFWTNDTGNSVVKDTHQTSSPYFAIEYDDVNRWYRTNVSRAYNTICNNSIMNIQDTGIVSLRIYNLSNGNQYVDIYGVR